MKRSILLICLSFVFAVQMGYSQKYKALVGGTIINTHNNKIIENSIILIKDSVIIDVGEKIKTKIPDKTEIIDISGKYIIPGLMDGHIHFFQSGGLYARPDGLDLRHRVPYIDEINWIKKDTKDFFNRYLACGITSIADMGGPFWNFNIRQQSYNNEMAPRTFTTGPLIASYFPAKLADDDLPIIKVNNEKEALDLVEKELNYKPDFIKIWYVLLKDNPNSLEEFFPIVKAVIDRSHKAGFPVFVHATELETAKKAIEAGCDVLVHNINNKEVDEEFLKMAKDKGIILIPTNWVFSSYAAVYSKQLKLLPVEQWLGDPKVIGSLYDMYELDYSELGERQRQLLVEKKPVVQSEILKNNLKKICDYGIIIAAGTDAGNVGVIHGPSLFHEFAFMAEAGLTPHQILVSATLNGAKLFGNDKILGSIEKNKLADLVILNSNPLEDILNTSDVYAVMKNGGELLYPDSLIQRSAADLAQIQLNAYNAHDIESFLQAYSNDVEVYSFPDSLRFRGKEQLRQVYSDFFEKTPELHCKLVSRMVKGNFAIDSELVTGIPERDNLTAIAVYEIKNGLIKKVWFLP